VIRAHIALGVVLMVASSCSKCSETADTNGAPVSASESAAADTEEPLRESARETLTANCAECHTTGLPTALPKALAVFDLAERDWSRHMSAAQLREAHAD
jgi:mono/diheme cytochrome c family protein